MSAFGHELTRRRLAWSRGERIGSAASFTSFHKPADINRKLRPN